MRLPESLLGITFALLGVAAQTDPVDDTFAVDLDHLASIGPSPGTVIDESNAAGHADFIDPVFVDLLNDGALTITVGKPISITPHDAYVNATRKHLGKTTLGDEPGIIKDYVGGRPFVGEPSLDDPRAGDKIAWNFRYGFEGDSGEIIEFYWQYRDARRDKIERELSFYAASMRMMHRHIQDPRPNVAINPAQVFNALYLRVIAPPDLRNTQLLVQRMEDDTKREHTWLYVATTRRVRRLASGQTTDAFLGSDIMIEDFIGYNGRLVDMKWSYHGTTHLLLPFYRHNEIPLSDRSARDGFQFAGFHGRGNCFPDVPWSMRKVYILEAEPTWVGHPLSKRRGYVDAQTHVFTQSHLYDRSERLWKVGMGAFSHPDSHHEHNKGIGVAIIDLAVGYDLQAQHCTTLQFEALVNRDGLRENDFVVQTLRKRAR